MKKIISQWKFDRLFEESYKDIGFELDNDNFELYDGMTEEWFKRLDHLNDDYIVIGPRIILNFFRDKLHK